MTTLNVLSRLMDYPTVDLIDHQADLLEAVQSMSLSKKVRTQLMQFVRTRTEADLDDWQSEYDGLFEKGRSLSLLLFEHVHGESRDRGQAMVDLLAQYRTAGLELSQRELPDYLPLFLEFLSTQGAVNAREGLAEISPVLAVLACRLEHRQSNYDVLFHALLELADVRVNLDELRTTVRGEERDDTRAALDKVWEEEAVTFGPGDAQDACGTGTSKPSEQQRRDQYIPLNLPEDASQRPAALQEDKV